MKKKTKSFLMNPWVVTTGSGLIILLVTIIIDVINATKIFSTIGNLFAYIWKAIIIFMNFELKVWWLLIGIILIFLILYLWAKYIDYQQAMLNKPEFIEYTQDTILHYKWKWTWRKDSYGIYYISTIYPICPYCDTPLSDSTRDDWGEYTCLRCNKRTTTPIPNIEDVKMLISDNIRRRYHK